MFFVMLNHPNPNVPALPMTCNDDKDVAFYKTREEAQNDAENNSLGEHFGYNVFELGNGV